MKKVFCVFALEFCVFPAEAMSNRIRSSPEENSPYFRFCLRPWHTRRVATHPEFFSSNRTTDASQCKVVCTPRVHHDAILWHWQHLGALWTLWKIEITSICQIRLSTLRRNAFGVSWRLQGNVLENVHLCVWCRNSKGDRPQAKHEFMQRKPTDQHVTDTKNIRDIRTKHSQISLLPQGPNSISGPPSFLIWFVTLFPLSLGQSQVWISECFSAFSINFYLIALL